MKLLVLDVEGTVFQTISQLPGATFRPSVWQSIAEALGKEAVKEEISTHRRWDSEEYHNYMEWMRDTISIHLRHNLTEPLFKKLIQSVEYNPGVARTLGSIDRGNFEPVLVSGGFRELARRAQRDFAIHHAFAACEYLFDESGKLTAYNLLPCDFEGKIDFVRLMLHEYGLGENDWVFVGDGRNDVPIAKSAPVSVAYRADKILCENSTYRISDFEDLLTILKTVDEEQAPSRRSRK
ncbi:MAG: haloacid dehalogenase-like hydrolase [Nitrososphaerota archaeon]|nr:haloacid dehalogenase-like hydrolase [Nitrososphaerota archaeon]